MDAVSNYPQCATKAERSCPRRPGHFSHHYYALLIALAAFGVLAFIFSALPNDDDIQQEFVRSLESKQDVFLPTIKLYPISGPFKFAQSLPRLLHQRRNLPVMT